MGELRTIANKKAMPLCKKRGDTGQQRAKKRFTCPEKRRYETAASKKALRLSQKEAIRDSSEQKSGLPVPKRGDTRQQRVKKRCACPKKRRYGTAASKKAVYLSRKEAIRDSSEQKSGAAVSKRSDTGQQRAKKRFTCPEKRRYGTTEGKKAVYLSQ
ncbi:hypothetical protein [Bacillus sp. Marseille-Q3570]|uniref:hypothetical protein n=1 Tax=Bacillus sp. Marseille-Q3570 TaxID=2963522 RepID=UPI0021B77CC8|nr:hypothetical protein [Bacillus sp. Marseille-Q3570]